MSVRSSCDVAVIGGGLSGLSAAVSLAAEGKRIILFEQRQHPGGRTNSFIDETTGDVVDNGQHLMMGCYHETRSYLNSIGSAHLATLQPSLHIDFVDPAKGSSTLESSSLPSPFHVLTGLLRLSHMSVFDRLRLLRVGKELLRTSHEKEKLLDSLTVDEWLTGLGQTDETKKYLWDTIAIGTLNDHPTKVSALLFFRVLRAAFVGTKDDSCLLIPRVGLSELLVEPAVRFLTDRHSEIRTGVRVQSLSVDGDRIRNLHTAAGDVVEAEAFVLAIPYFDLPGILPDEMIVPSAPLFVSTPILSINLWFDRQVFDKEFVAVLGSTIQWIFNRNLLCTSPGTGGENSQHLSLVISGAEEYVEFDKESIVQIALEDLRRILPAMNGATLVRSIVIKEKRATFTPKPGLEMVRPDTRTKLKNLFLAGDWTNTGLPATIEGAVMSGRKAAISVQQPARRSET